MNDRYKIWYIPQIPMPAFEREYTDFETAKTVLNALIDLSLFEFDNMVKPDYADMAGIDRWTGSEWETLDEDHWA